jgi:hypothetical protein
MISWINFIGLPLLSFGANSEATMINFKLPASSVVDNMISGITAERSSGRPIGKQKFCINDPESPVSTPRASERVSTYFSVGDSWAAPIV